VVDPGTLIKASGIYQDILTFTVDVDANAAFEIRDYSQITDSYRTTPNLPEIPPLDLTA
jgi:hypothetical protein